MSRKVVIVIVEGESDEALLVSRLNEKYSNVNIRFEVQNGDILYNLGKKTSILSRMDNTVKAIISKRKYRRKDVLCIIHIIDTDGCLIPSNYIEIDEYQDRKTLYRLESINVDSDIQRKNIIERNKKRTENINLLIRDNYRVLNKYNYQLYYLSRNLEHVIFDQPNPDRKSKTINVDVFVDRLNSDIEVFLKDYMPKLDNSSYYNNYKKSWEYIKKGTNSLKRKTNVPLLFDYLSNL